MAIDPVPGYGQITSSNAKEIYTAYRKGEVELTPAQRNRTESFLTNEDFDEIDYKSDVARKDGKDQLGEDVENAESHDGQGGNATATSAGAIATGALTAIFGKQVLGSFQRTQEGTYMEIVWSAVVAGAIGLALAAVSVVSAFLYDNGFKDRCGAKDNAESTNATIDDNANVLIESMDSMNADAEEYKTQSDQYTKDINDATANSASLEAQIADAQAAGDIDGVKRLKDELKKIKDNGFEEELEGMEEIRSMMEEYGYANEMALGVSEGGQTVSDFLKEGTALGAVAAINTVCLTAATVVSGICAGRAIIAWKTPFEIAYAVAASCLFIAATILLGTAAGVMANKTVKEFECGSSGRDMQDHVTTLNDTITQQQGYMDTTLEDYNTIDDDSTKSQEKAEEAAKKSNKNRSGGVGALPDKPKEEKDNSTTTTTTTSTPSSSGNSSSNPFA